MLPNMSDVLTEWEVPVTIKTVIQQTIDFKPNNVVTSRIIPAVIQVAQKNRLNADQIDFQLEYKTLHSVEPVENGEYLEFEGKDFKVIDSGAWQRYGYTEALCEATNEPLIQVTP